MLRLVDIDKTYKASSNDVKALKKVSLNFRKSEFVSVLGPSGSGKTTLLNIIGGLDKYTSGDLIIAGKSTKAFKDRDWDFYRNERIGFIFQSYNLIPHQTVLGNVELALTISGVSKAERTQRAKEALDKVGLSDQYYKRPNQLSGGQCQRVAIARALVNDPEILLADEPTGALDTKTSTQIMDLIKEISRDRLVIMVTHNPDIAEKYSNRIIRLLDGEIVEDSNQFSSEDEIKEVSSLSTEQIDKKSKAKMGLWTAMRLSFRNLISKKGRTILVSIASSIGIIGVSTVLSVSFGVSNYVVSMQDDMLSSYPLQIAEQNIDMTALATGLSNTEKAELAKFDVSSEVGMESFIEYLMDKYRDLTNFKTNDINDDVVEYVNSIPKEDVATIEYRYGIDMTNNIFSNWISSGSEEYRKQWVSTNGLTQRYIAELQTVDGFSDYARYVNLFTNFMKQMPNDKEYVLSQYDELAGSTFGLADTDLTLVVTSDTTLTDVLLAQLGIYPHDDFINIGRKAVEIYRKGTYIDEEHDTRGLKQKLNEGAITREQYDEEIKKLEAKYPYKKVFNDYEDLLNREFYYIPHKTIWEYGNVSSDTKMQGSFVIYDTNKLYSLNYDSTYTDYGYDILSGVEIEFASGTSKEVYFVRGASSNRDGETFYDAPSAYGFTPWMEINVPAGSTLIEVFIEAVATQTLPLTGRRMSISAKSATTVSFSRGLTKEEEYTTPITPATETDTVNGFYYPIEAKDEWLTSIESGAIKLKITSILRAKENVNFGCLSRGVYYTKALADRYMRDAIDANNKIINDATNGFKAFYSSGKAVTQTFKAFCRFNYVDSNGDGLNPTLRTDGYANALNGDLSNSISSLFSSAFGGLTSSSTNQVYMRALSGLKTSYDTETYSATYDALPEEIEIYPTDFNSKDHITKYLDRWNTDEVINLNGREIKPDDRSDISYTDTVAMIINVINSLITIVTSALVAFTSLSLVVSCFMIAVITYISVMERVKEIGVIRSLGGRKKDVSRLFTAENFMTGLASGVLGIAVTYLLSILINVIVSFFGAPAISMLPWWMALIMILLSILLNVISGLIPSRNAAKQDPVNALRSE